MKFESIFKFLVPQDDKFYKYLERSTENLVNTTVYLKKLPTASAEELAEIVRHIQEKEHNGDTITHEIFSDLHKTFITPIDREDIHVLASVIDDILDNINGCGTRFSLYNIKNCPPSVSRLVDILTESIRELHQGVTLIRHLKKPDQLRTVLKKINDYENEADTVFENGVAELFVNEKDPINIVKLKEILVSLETATDKCEDAANVLEGILIKNA